MSSFTNSYLSLRKSGRIHWPIFWFLTVTFFCVAFGLWEVFLFQKGYTPSVADSKYLWAFERLRLRFSDKRPLVFLGSSHSAAGIDISYVKSRYPQFDVFQLSIERSRAIGTLLDFIRDKTFNGIILLDLTEFDFDPDFVKSQDDYLRAYKESSSYNEILNTWFRSRLQNRFAALRAELNFSKVAISVIKKRKFNWKIAYRMTLDRSRSVDFYIHGDLNARRVKIEKNIKRHPVTEASFETWERQIKKYREPIHGFLDRGSKLIFVNFPVSGPKWEHSESQYPKSRFWDRINSILRVPTIHFKDYTELSRFDCPDWFHLNSTEKESFTGALFDIVDKNYPLE